MKYNSLPVVVVFQKDKGYSEDHVCVMGTWCYKP